MKLVNSVKTIFSGLYLSLKRFPLTILLSASTAAVLIAISEIRPSEDSLAKSAMILALGIPVSLCIKLYFERKSGSKLFISWTAYLIGAAALALYYFFLLDNFNMVEVTRYIAVSIAFYLAFIYIPYLPKKLHFETYVITLFSNFFITVIYSMVLYAGLSAILFAVDKLLGVRIQGEVYYYTFLIVVFIFAVSYFLSGVPFKDEDLSTKNYPKILKILLLYIVMPLISAYTVILYIYFAKIIFTAQWPVNIVTHLVLWYSIVSAIVLFFLTPIKEDNTWANKFIRFFPKIIIPLLFMMFISITIRIKAYGVTENRYFVIAMSLWVLGVMLYFSFIRNLKNIILFVSLSIIAIVSVLGPASSYSVSKLSQNNRLESILVKNNMLNNRDIQPSDNISKEDRIEISSILNYFVRNHKLKEIRYVPENFKIEDMSRIFGFAFENPNYDAGPDNYFYFVRSDLNTAIDVSGYDYLFDRNNLTAIAKAANNSLEAAFTNDTATVKISLEGKQIYKNSFDSFIKNLIDKYGTQSREKNLTADEMTIVEENDKVKVKIIITHISGMKDESSQNIISKNIELYLLVKIK